MRIFLLLSFNLLLIYLLNKIFIKKNFLLDRKILTHKNFISTDIVPISVGFIIIINLLLLISNYLHNKNNYWSVMCHCLVHLLISIGLCFMYKDYYENNRTKSPPLQSEIDLENALALFLTR